jgi:hypothetical protein
MKKKKCMGRTPGNVLTSYACSRYARPGSDWCYWHDPATEAERLERAQRASHDRRAWSGRSARRV